MNTDKSKIIRVSMVRLSTLPSYFPEKPELIEQYYKDTMMSQFKRAVSELKPEDIINVREEDGVIYYDIDVVVKKY